jgi:hypothetical protein
MTPNRAWVFALVFTAFVSSALRAQTSQPDWKAFDEETMRHFQAIVRFDTADPPGGEKPAAEYIKQVLDREGIPAQLVALEPNRPNVIARLKGNGKKRPLLVMGNLDVVSVDAKKWTEPRAFSVTESGLPSISKTRRSASVRTAIRSESSNRNCCASRTSTGT